jgi:hypothetical protein
LPVLSRGQRSVRGRDSRHPMQFYKMRKQH